MSLIPAVAPLRKKRLIFLIYFNWTWHWHLQCHQIQIQAHYHHILLHSESSSAPLRILQGISKGSLFIPHQFLSWLVMAAVMEDQTGGLSSGSKVWKTEIRMRQTCGLEALTSRFISLSLHCIFTWQTDRRVRKKTVSCLLLQAH